MKDIVLSYPEVKRPLDGRLQLPGSKSESNRLLLLQGLYPNLRIANLSNSDDTRFMQRGLGQGGGLIDIHHAGTAMRFLTAYYATRQGAEVELTGSPRMKERPIGLLVDALRSLGSDIEYLGREGYPPLRIRGSKPDRREVRIRADVSSQFISALLLCAPSWPGGILLTLEGPLTSVPYVRMTLSLLEQLGIASEFDGSTVVVEPRTSVPDLDLTVESDWSAASYFYSLLALAPPGSQLELDSFRADSLQGDSRLQTIYSDFGVRSEFYGETLRLTRLDSDHTGELDLDLSDAPDIAQTIAVTCFGLGRACRLRGLHTLPIKETDRLAALRTELAKLGGEVHTDKESLHLRPRSGGLPSGVFIETFNDHRMAMSFAPLALLVDLGIRDRAVVGKSYPDFWNHLAELGFLISPR